MTDVRRLLICGTSSQAEDVAELALGTPGVELAGFVENLDRGRCAEPMLGLPVHWIDELGELTATHVAVCGLGTTRRSRLTGEAEERGLRFTTLVHPTAHVPPSAQLGDGTIIGARCVLGTQVRTGRHVFVNRGALIGHHTRIGDHASLMPGSNVAGNCTIGAGVFIGMGSVVINDLEVGEGAVVGAGSVVVGAVEARTQVVGVPARVVRTDVERR
jgi:sugar O-acyltransferase (sialic acid O-acetyltransferase NeuD family)